MSNGPKVASLFATPVVTLDVADSSAINAELRHAIEQREKTNPGTRHSNLGGWQSDWEMDRWGGAAAIKLLAIGRNTANRVTSDRHGNAVTINWRANMWANINRSGHGNEFHSHPGSFWSGVYYVDDGGIDADPALGGELEFMDPRGPGPAMYAPQLAFGSAGLQHRDVCGSGKTLIGFAEAALDKASDYAAELRRRHAAPASAVQAAARRASA